MLIGAGFYRDRYRKTADGWKISETGYDRTYDASMSTKALELQGESRSRASTSDATSSDGDQRAGPQPPHDLDQRVVVDGHAARRRSAVGGVHEERAAVARDPRLVDAHHHGVRVLRDVAGSRCRCSGWCRTGTAPSCTPAWCCRSGSSCRRPTSGRAPPGRTAGRRRGWAAVPKAKSRVKMPIGVFISPSWVCGTMPLAPTWAGMPTRDRLPAAGGALLDVHLGGRAAGADNGQHLGGVADVGLRTTGPRHGWGAPN